MVGKILEHTGDHVLVSTTNKSFPFYNPLELCSGGKFHVSAKNADLGPLFVGLQPKSRRNPSPRPSKNESARCGFENFSRDRKRPRRKAALRIWGQIKFGLSMACS